MKTNQSQQMPGPWRIDTFSTRAVIWTDRPGDWKPGIEPDPSGRNSEAKYIGEVTLENAGG